MAVEVIPLGRPELDMTRAEMLAVSDASLEQCIALYGIFFSLLFAYVVAMYLAGSQLTRIQYSIANTLFLLTMLTVILGVYETWESSLLWADFAFEGPRYIWNDLRLWFNTATMVVSVFLAMWFGRRVRHPALD